MKKEDSPIDSIRDKFRVTYVPTYKSAYEILPERVTPKLVSKVNPTQQSLSSKATPVNNQRASTIQVPSFHSGDIRAFDSLQDAKIAFDRFIYDKDIKLEFSQEQGFNYRVVFQAIILCKFLGTVKWLFNDFRKSYNINYTIKLFWKKTTWHASYNKAAYTFEITTGCNGNGTVQTGSYRNQNIYMFEPLSYAISDYIYKAQYFVPKNRMDEILKVIFELSKVRKVGEIDTYMLP